MKQPTSLDTPTTRQPDDDRGRWVMPVVAIGVLLSGVDLFIVNVAMPDLAADLGVGNLGDLSWVLNAYTIAFAALLVPAGRISDLLGAKRTFLTGMLLFVGASALCAVSPDLGWLISARVVQAVGAAVMIPSSLGVLLATTTPERRGVAVRTWASLGGIGAALGPVLGGVLVQLDWSWVFLVNVPIGLAAVAVGAKGLPAVPGHAGSRPRIGGSLLLVGTVAAAVTALVNGHDWGWASAVTVAFAGTALVGAAANVVSVVRNIDPLVDLELLRTPQFGAMTVTLLVFHIAFGAMLLSIVLWLQGVRGFTALEAGLAIAPGPLLVPVIATIAGRFASRVRPGQLVALGGVTFAAGVALWALLVDPDTGYATTILPGMLLTGVGVGLALPASMALGTAHLPAHRFSTGSAVLSTARQIGLAVGVAVLVALLGAGDDVERYTVAWWVTAAIAIASVATTPRRSRR